MIELENGGGEDDEILEQHKKRPCEEFLHTFNMKICIHKTHLEVKL